MTEEAKHAEIRFNWAVVAGNIFGQMCLLGSHGGFEDKPNIVWGTVVILHE